MLFTLSAFGCTGSATDATTGLSEQQAGRRAVADAAVYHSEVEVNGTGDGGAAEQPQLADAAPAATDIKCGYDPQLPSLDALQAYGLTTGVSPTHEHCLEMANIHEDELDPSDKRMAWTGQTGGTGTAVDFATEGAVCHATSAKWLDATSCTVMLLYAKQSMSMTKEILSAYTDIEITGPAGINAVRHFVWVALIAAQLSSSDSNLQRAVSKTRALTDIHERFALKCNGTPQECEWDEEADHHNNELGIAYGVTLRDQTQFDREQSIRAKAAEYLNSRDQLDMRGGCRSRYISVSQGC